MFSKRKSNILSDFVNIKRKNNIIISTNIFSDTNNQDLDT